MSLIIREMQIRTTMKYHLTPVRMTIINKSINVGVMWRKGNPCALLVGFQIGTAIMDNSIEDFSKN